VILGIFVVAGKGVASIGHQVDMHRHALPRLVYLADAGKQQCSYCSGVLRLRHPPTGKRLAWQRHRVRTLFDGNQRPCVLGTARLAAWFPARLRPGRHWFGMRLVGAGRQRGTTGRLLEAGFLLRPSRFQFADPGQQRTDHHLRLRRLPGNHLFGAPQFMRHAPDVVPKTAVKERPLSLQGVSVYQLAASGTDGEGQRGLLTGQRGFASVNVCDTAA